MGFPLVQEGSKAMALSLGKSSCKKPDQRIDNASNREDRDVSEILDKQNDEQGWHSKFS